jgi:hypothetical protein
MLTSTMTGEAGIALTQLVEILSRGRRFVRGNDLNSAQ